GRGRGGRRAAEQMKAAFLLLLRFFGRRLVGFFLGRRFRLGLFLFVLLFVGQRIEHQCQRVPQPAFGFVDPERFQRRWRGEGGHLQRPPFFQAVFGGAERGKQLAQEFAV